MAKNKRESMKIEIASSLDSTLSELQSIWKEIGIDERQREEREGVVLLHLQNLLDDMMREEKEMKKRLLERVENWGKQILGLSEELNVPPFEPDSNLTVLQKEKALSVQVESLKQEKEERLTKLQTLKKTEQDLCDVLCITPYYIPTGSIPSEDQLQALKDHISSLTAEKEERREVFLSTKQAILSLLDVLEQDPNTSFEREVICEEEDTFVLSEENMNALRALRGEMESKEQDNKRLADSIREELDTIWTRLQSSANDEDRPQKQAGHKPSDLKALQQELDRLQLLKKQNLKKVIDATREEIFSWWDKCFYSREQRNAFEAAYDDEYTEELLQLHDEEVVRVKSYYEENKELIDAVKKREEMWKKMLEFEKKASDPNRFNNRGGVLLQEEKMRTKLNKELPKVEARLADRIVEWEESNGKPFLVDGVRFVDYVQAQWAAHENERKLAKAQRLNARSKQTEQEMKWGSKPTTPVKRKFIGTPSRTPGKRLKGVNASTFVNSPVRLGSTTLQPSPASSRKPPHPGMSHPRTPKTPSISTASSCATLSSSMGMSFGAKLTPHIPFPTPPKSSRYGLRSKKANTPKQLRATPQRTNRRNVLREKNTDYSMSTSTMSGGTYKSSNMSINSTCTSYSDFARHLDHENDPNCRSSVVASPNRPKHMSSRVAGF